MKILILSDGGNWIVNRIVDRMIQDIPFEFTKDHYTNISAARLLEEANKQDLIHYSNWDIQEHHRGILNRIKVPFLMSVRSHRYYPFVKTLIGKVHIHTITPALQAEFPGSYYIPDGIFDQFKSEFVVGFAGAPDEYKGFRLIKQACEELGVTFKPATGNIPPDQMHEYYKSIDLYVCASIAEGHSTPVMECLAMNKPVITTDVGLPCCLDIPIHKIERSVESIKQGILRYYTAPKVLPQYSWSNICEQFKELYLLLKEK